ncbi:MAG: 50S ribosomal protein L30 [Mucinivorans sp.]
MSKIKITQVKSRIGSSAQQRANLAALGLHKTNSVVEQESCPQIMGMVTKVKHLVKVEQVK